MHLFKSPIVKAILPTLMLFLLLRLVFWLNTFPNPDEAYYWLWGQHPDFSYYDHPPFQAWIQGLFTKLLGQSFFTLRLPNLMSNGIFFYTYYQITQYLYGKNRMYYFGVAIALLIASPLYFLFLSLAWHDHWLITFSLIAAFQFIQFLDSYTSDGKGNSKRLYAAAIALGLALLCKYNAIFVGIGCLATMVANKQWHKLLRDRRLYLAVLITVCFLLPILIWNITNDFQSFRYYSDRSIDNTGFRLKIGEMLGFIAFSILMLSPINVWAIVQSLRTSTKPFTNENTLAYHAVTFWIFTTSTLTLIIVSLVSTALYYWNILAYLLLFPVLPQAFFRGQEVGGWSQKLGGRSQENSRLPILDSQSEQSNNPQSSIPNPQSSITSSLRLFYAGQFYGLLFAALLVFHYSVLPLSVFGSADSDPDSRLLFGWEQVGAIMQKQATELGEHSFLVTTDYRMASALAYQLNKPDVLAISDRIDQFDFWYNANKLTGHNAIILADDWYPLTPKLIAQFERVSKPQTYAVNRFGFQIKHYYVVKAYNFQG
ncbi:PMT family glycosyltransferase, 4-amino-4-deoxy-L-arabinose transferase [Leptolyngbyaceae cyanobacterium JSC-12]|nr:PMT family glycosyltransferase, 4-amino-4-deoxy-L-arabinose transferase [Leptolyngbyaceae cyanobacterium JSC-12]